MTSFVFLSHANPDKPAVRHIVDALIAANIKVWLDNPAAMGYTADEVRANFYRLSADKRWQDEIDAALNDASAIIVCFSKRFDEHKRQKWRDEAAIARAGKKLVSCRIDDLDPASLANSYAEQQIPDVRGTRMPAELATALGLLVDDVKRMIAERVEGRLRDAARVRPRDWFMPYLVDRTRQEDAIGDAVEAVSVNGGVRAFLLAGPENEGVDEFVDRLQRHACPKRLDGRSWHRVVVEWTSGIAHIEAASNFQRRLAHELKLRQSSTPDEIVAVLAKHQSPVAVVSYVRAESWRTDECVTVRAWLGLWERLDASASAAGVKIAVIPILCLKMPPAKAGWRGVPRGRAPGAPLSNAGIWANVCAIREPGFLMSLLRPAVTRPAFRAPPILHPIPRQDVDTWLDRHVATELEAGPSTEAREIIRRLYAKRRANADGVTLDDFVTSMRPLFGART